MLMSCTMPKQGVEAFVVDPSPSGIKEHQRRPVINV